MSYANGSPHRPPLPDTDLEAGPPTARSGDFDDGDVSDPFDITRTKNASIERLRRWRVRHSFSSSTTLTLAHVSFLFVCLIFGLFYVFGFRLLDICLYMFSVF